MKIVITNQALTAITVHAGRQDWGLIQTRRAGKFHSAL